MTKGILGFIILLAIIGASSAYTWHYYHRPEIQKPGYEMSIPEKAYQLRQNNKDPMGKFQKDMGERVERAEDRGVDLKSSDKHLNEMRQNKNERPTPAPTDFKLKENEVLKEVLSSASPAD